MSLSSRRSRRRSLEGMGWAGLGGMPASTAGRKECPCVEWRVVNGWLLVLQTTGRSGSGNKLLVRVRRRWGCPATNGGSGLLTNKPQQLSVNKPRALLSSTASSHSYQSRRYY